MPNESRKAVIYCRVSSAEQVKNGHGLSSQETRCREFAKYRKLEVIEVFNEEGISGGLIDRPAMKRMLAMLRRHPQEQIVVLIDDISRLARDLKAHIELRVAIQQAGGVLQSPSIEFGEDSDSQLVENMLASVSQHQRQKNAEQVKHRMRSRMMKGYWFLKAPRGYKIEKVPGHGKMMVRHEPLATIVQNALEGFATDRFSAMVEVQAYLEMQPDFPKDRKGIVHIQRVSDMLRQKLYAGYFEFPDWGIGLTKAQHEPLISFETYTKIQGKLHGRAKAPARKDINQDFALRGFVLCDGCERPLRSCWSTGKYEKFPYYLCHTKGCGFYGKSVRREKIEGEFGELLKTITPASSTIDMVNLLIDEVKERRLGNHKAMMEALIKEKQTIGRKIESFLDRIVAADSPILIATYERQIKQLEEQRILTDEKIRNCGTVDESLRRINRTSIDFLKNPHEYWVSSDLPSKRLVLKATFARPLAYHRNEGYRTPDLSLPFSLLKELSGQKGGMVEHGGLSSNSVIRLVRAIDALSNTLESKSGFGGKTFAWEPIAHVA